MLSPETTHASKMGKFEMPGTTRAIKMAAMAKCLKAQLVGLMLSRNSVNT
ncbi:hypothetical protein N482_24600 [Pseudoalteromonas luteoviolacea NCIMB 1942]|uniref:Uncharacterized protein n=1 Tax=Pseudoalteromonas luteoviolacea NCIMB 1942 TaxID=1365253 RepID=A0A167G2W4_9GAMM|nr:hypothetical protein N482_24600 [Pseudoalteromonas luteoviolacea NCIMB 1942]